MPRSSKTPYCRLHIDVTAFRALVNGFWVAFSLELGGKFLALARLLSGIVSLVGVRIINPIFGRIEQCQRSSVFAPTDPMNNGRLFPVFSRQRGDDVYSAQDTEMS